MIEELKKKIAAFARGWIGSLVIAFLLATSIKSAIADWYVVPTGSMKPTIIEGDRIFVNKLAYDFKFPYTTKHLSVWDNPERGDIVVFYSPRDRKRLVKRVVGLPGDKLSMENNRVFINGKELTYQESPEISEYAAKLEENQQVYAENLADCSHTVMITHDQSSIRTFSSITIPVNYYFMMGDNRDNSADSRYFGPVPRNSILGRATAVVMSLDPERHYKPRWGRFFSDLI